MDIVVYEAFDLTFVSIIEQLLQDEGVAFSTTGAADVGLAATRVIQIRVRKEDEAKAKELISKIVS
jgi:hypothetical protein